MAEKVDAQDLDFCTFIVCGFNSHLSYLPHYFPYSGKPIIFTGGFDLQFFHIFIFMGVINIIISIKNLILLLIVIICCCIKVFIQYTSLNVEAHENLVHTTMITEEIQNRNIELTTYSDEFIQLLEQELLKQSKVHSENKNVWVSLQVPKIQSSFKAQESHTVFNLPNTLQYKLQYDGNAWTDEYGFRRYGEEGYYMVAMGSYYTPKCGEILRITLVTGYTFEVISGDVKADVHTDINNQKCLVSNSLLEFIVDMNVLSTELKKMGDMSYTPNSLMKGKITKIERLEK